MIIVTGGVIHRRERILLHFGDGLSRQLRTQPVEIILI